MNVKDVFLSVARTLKKKNRSMPGYVKCSIKSIGYHKWINASKYPKAEKMCNCSSEINDRRQTQQKSVIWCFKKRGPKTSYLFLSRCRSSHVANTFRSRLKTFSCASPKGTFYKNAHSLINDGSVYIQWLEDLNQCMFHADTYTKNCDGRISANKINNLPNDCKSMVFLMSILNV